MPIELTKEGEAYATAASRERDGVFVVALDSRDRTSIATMIDRLINFLDDLRPDPDLEPWLGSGDNREGDGDEDEDDDHGDIEDDGDCEPWSGRLETINQARADYITVENEPCVRVRIGDDAPLSMRPGTLVVFDDPESIITSIRYL